MQAKRISDHRSYKMSDREVVSRVVAGEKELYEILLRRYNQLIYRVVRSYLNDEDEAEDLMQEIWIKAWQNLNRFRGEASFSTWLVRIAVNEALMSNRKKKNRARYPANRHSTHKQLAQLTGSENMNPEKKTVQRENRRLLEQAIDRLPENYRTVYILREVEGMDTTEAAACLQISENNTKVRLYRARSLLKNELYRLTGNTDAFEFGNSRCDAIVDTVMEQIL